MYPNHNIPVGARTALLGPAPLPATPRMRTSPLPPMPPPGPAYPSPPTTPRTVPQPSMARQAPPPYHTQGYPSPVSPQRLPLPGLQLQAEASYAPFNVHEAIRYTGAAPAPCNWDVRQSPAALRVALNAAASNPPIWGIVTIQLFLVPGFPPKVVQLDKPAGQPVTVGEVLSAIYNTLRQPISQRFSESIGAMKLARVAPRAQGGAVCYLHVLETAIRFMGVRASASTAKTLEVHFAP